MRGGEAGERERRYGGRERAGEERRDSVRERDREEESEGGGVVHSPLILAHMAFRED